MRSRNKDNTERLRGIIRQQRSIIKQLRKQLSKKEIIEEDYTPELTKTSIESNNTCPQCKEGVLRKTHLGIRTLIKCDYCEQGRFEKTKGFERSHS